MDIAPTDHKGKRPIRPLPRNASSLVGPEAQATQRKTQDGANDGSAQNKSAKRFKSTTDERQTIHKHKTGANKNVAADTPRRDERYTQFLAKIDGVYLPIPRETVRVKVFESTKAWHHEREEKVLLDKEGNLDLREVERILGYSGKYTCKVSPIQ